MYAFILPSVTAVPLTTSSSNTSTKTGYRPSFVLCSSQWTGLPLTSTSCYPIISFTTITKHLITACDSSSTTQTHPESLDIKWPAFATHMRNTGEIPGYDEWHTLLHGCVIAGDSASKAVWIVNLMRDTGRTPTATTYEMALTVCVGQDDRVAAFHLVEHMYTDKVLLGDVELPKDMEDMLRRILPPEAFE